MKDKILTFVSNLKEIFLKRKASIPKSIHAHKLALKAIEQEESKINAAISSIQQLNEADNQHGASILFYTFMEQVVPLIANWKKRLQKIKDTDNTKIDGHVRVFAQYKEMKQQLYGLALEANLLGEEPFVQIELGANKPAKAIIANYNKEKFLAEHALQAVEAQDLSQTKGSFQSKHF